MKTYFLIFLSLFFFEMIYAQTFKEKIRFKMKERLAERLSKEPAPVINIFQSQSIKTGLYTQKISVNELERYYKIYIPKNFLTQHTYPLVLTLHGGGGDMNVQANNEFYQQLSTADKYNYIAIFPNGFSPYQSGKFATWNAGDCCGQSQDLKIDDIKFIRAIIEKTKEQLKIDNKRIFANGMSNGAMMSYRIACELSDIFKGIASVAGTDNTLNCNPINPISIFHTHAKDDDHVNFNGGIGPSAVDKDYITDFKSVAHTINKWVKLNKCQPIAKKINEGKGYSCERYEDCKNGSMVQLCVTESGGHSWPGGKSPRLMKHKNSFQGFSASEENWLFFSKLK